MCGRFSLDAAGEELAEAFDLQAPPSLSPRFNIAPSQPVLVIRADAAGRRQASSLRWGLPARAPSEPEHGADGGRGELLINARSETAASKPAFRDAFRHRRCLLPADGFYEWKRTREGPRPYRVRRRDGRLFAFAGLWAPAPAEEPGQPEGACLILTTDANDLLAPLHDRMPVILPPESYEQWLSAAGAAVADLSLLLRPFPAADLTAHPVSTAVNSPATEGPQCAEPIEERPPSQGVLFPEMDDP